MQIEKTGFKSKKKLRKSGKHNYVKELFTVLFSLEKKKECLSVTPLDIWVFASTVHI